MWYVHIFFTYSCQVEHLYSPTGQPVVAGARERYVGTLTNRVSGLICRATRTTRRRLHRATCSRSNAFQVSPRAARVRSTERVQALAPSPTLRLYLDGNSSRRVEIWRSSQCAKVRVGEQLLKRFQSSMQRSGVLRELRNRRFFRSKGEQTRLDKARSLRRIRRRRNR